MTSPIEQELRKMIATHGYSVCHEHRRVEFILRDLCPTQRWEVSALTLALNEGVVADLVDWQDTLATEIMLTRLAKRLESNRGLSEKAARWAVETWTSILLEPSRPIGNRRYEFVGSRGNVSAPFNLDPGLVVFEATHSGRENFLVDLFDPQERYLQLIFNQVGQCRSKRPLGISSSGAYHLRIKADGDWEISVRQSRPASVEPTPLVLSGSGQSASPFVRIQNSTSNIEAKHIGKDNFAVILLSDTGRFIDLLVNEVGDCSIQRAFRATEGSICMLDVNSRGDWTIRVT